MPTAVRVRDSGPSTVFTRRLASFGKLELAPGKRLPLVYAHVSDPADAVEVRRTVEQLKDEGGQGARFHVDSPRLIADGVPSTADVSLFHGCATAVS